ncbi:MAG TPA: DUF6544 family protein [Thermomicrobiales bacterium]|nr:DUF6544 family protein [Thermomicrobiales bacterium]
MRAARTMMGMLAAALTIVGTLVAGRTATRRRFDREMAALLAARRPSGLPPTARDLSELPLPIQRWLQWSRAVDRQMPAVVRLRQTGRLRDAPGTSWRSFVAQQGYTLDPPGFVWVARVPVAPLVELVVTDRFRAGRGAAEVRLFGLVPIARGAGPELDQGALSRFLDETMWFPAAALLPAIRWEPIDATRARATMIDGATSVAAVFTIDDRGRFLTVEADRFRTVGDRLVLTPWATPARDWGRFDGVRMPTAGAGVWRLPSGDFTYIELHVTDVDYDESR